ncbi:MAG: sulfotransferase [Bacteroidia bacterium]|nr:sulfotransferase [Bacteroidia bacterium]
MSYANFKDPIGLLRRMLKSGNSAAYFTILREGLGVAAKPVDALLAGREKRYIEQAPAAEVPMIFILGGSRSGTTVLYQTLAQYLPVSYFNNLSAPFPRSVITAARLFNRFIRKTKGNFKNYYGSVAGFGGPNDGFHVWNRWLGEDRNAVPEHISEADTRDMQQFFYAWWQAFKKPFLNKNNRNSLCVPLFWNTFPNSYFIEIRRNPVYVIQSLIQSREAVQGSKYVAWGLGSQDSDPDRDPLGYVDDIARQVYQVEQELEAARACVPDERYINISYQDFCQDPESVVQAVSMRVWGHPVPTDQLTGLKPLNATDKQRLGDEEFQRIQQTVAALYGHTQPVS